MKEDQIKAIAEEYAKWVSDNPKDYPWHSTDARAVLTFLNEKFCIVEREKVMEAFTQNNYFAQHPSNPSDSYYQGVIDTLTHLFGASMFHQNE